MFNASQILNNNVDNADIFTEVKMYELLSKAYLNLNNIEQYELYKQKLDSTQNKINQNINDARSFVIIHIENNALNKKKQGNKSTLLGILILCLLLIPAGYYYFKTKSDYKKFCIILKQQKYKKNCNAETLKSDHNSRNSIIPIKTEEILRKKLEEFEQSKSFLNPKMSLVFLAKQLNTNTKYLSELINRTKGKNFNTYLNELRINYIIAIMKSESKYQLYKISALAAECGYISHSTFSTAFKSVTGLSPSSFIHFLKKKKNEKI